MSEQSVNTDKRLLKEFVDPTLCRKLLDAGIIADTPYFWKVNGTSALLYTYVFDIDFYYEQADKNTEYIKPLDETLPAYQLKDIEPTIPNYLLERNASKEYVLMCDKIYDMKSKTAKRMPDVFALMLLDALHDRKLDVVNVNSIIAANDK